jgi:hypothetical protein
MRGTVQNRAEEAEADIEKFLSGNYGLAEAVRDAKLFKQQIRADDKELLQKVGKLSGEAENSWFAGLGAIYHIISYHIISYHIISYHVISYHIISYHIISYQIISCHVMSYHIISYHIISYHIISYHIISYHIISYHIMSCHAMPCHAMSCHVLSCPVVSCHPTLRTFMPRHGTPYFEML